MGPEKLYAGGRVRTSGWWMNVHTCDHCNLACSYCYFRNKSKRLPTYDVGRIVELVRRVEGFVTICFYGGEPTLNVPFMEQLVAAVDAVPEGRRTSFALQTNGTLLDRVPDALLARFVGIGVSIDGVEEVTDKRRGQGVHRQVLANVQAAQPKARVPILARMTLGEESDLARDVGALLPHFGAVYWQIDNDLAARPYGDFVACYIAALPKVVDLWEEQARAGRIVNLVPVFGVYWQLTRASGKPPFYYHCRPGAGAITIDAGGTIYTCPEGVFRGGVDTGGADVIATLDTLGEGWPTKSWHPKPECEACDIHAACGGRCVWTRSELYCDCSCALVRLVRENAARLWKHLSLKQLKEMYATILTTEIMP